MFTDVQVFLKKYIVIAHIRDDRSVMTLEATETSVKVKTGWLRIRARLQPCRTVHPLQLVILRARAFHRGPKDLARIFATPSLRAFRRQNNWGQYRLSPHFFRDRGAGGLALESRQRDQYRPSVFTLALPTLACLVKL